MKRLESGGRINRSKPIDVCFDGKALPAFEGDTLASAMLAGGCRTVARSFKYHRPRGVYSAGTEEPGAMVHLRDGNRHEPNARATITEAYDGLVSSSQNAWPNVKLDIGIVNDLLAPFFSAGFYYKTFIGPFKTGTRFWMMCEVLIRKAAGLGRATYLQDPDNYDKRNAFCDVMVIGGGVAGLSAALAAGRSGATVILVEQDFQLGGAALSEPLASEGDEWIASIESELSKLPNVRILTRTTAFGAYEHDSYALIERVSDHFKSPVQHQVRQRYWQVHAKRSVLATGAIERPLVFGGNDKPGVMLAGAVQTYLNRYAVLVGDEVVVSSNNDSAYQVAFCLAQAGAAVTMVDMRDSVKPTLEQASNDAGITLIKGHGVLQAKGRSRVKSALIVPIDDKGRAIGAAKTITCNVIAVSGGWSPAVHLWSQLANKPVYKEQGACFVPDPDSSHSMQAAGIVMAATDLSEVVRQGFTEGLEAAQSCGKRKDAAEPPDVFAAGPFWQQGLQSIWCVRTRQNRTQGKAFIDFQHDVKLSDIDQAHLEGYVSVEHLKRYTTTGMATDQGKLSNINAMARMAELRDATIPDVGTTTFRPPFTPITVGAVVAHEHGIHFRPVRLSPIHYWHVEHGAKMLEAGAWMRPRFYPENNETLTEGYIREAAHVREYVGMVDVSTLGKIAVQGPDAAEFLNRIYVNGWKALKVGRLRYGMMLREDGIVMDDGATARLGELDYFMSTTTANAARVLAFSEQLLQTAWRDLKVHVTSVTDQWAGIAVAGPSSRALLSLASGGIDLSNENLPSGYLHYAEIASVSVRIQRMSYSGELAYEVYIPASHGRHVWEALLVFGEKFNLKPYGTESMGALRIEKGHVAGPEIEGRTTIGDLGMEGFASSKKPFVGSVLRKRPLLVEDSERPVLIGLELTGKTSAKAGSLLFSASADIKGHGEGWVSSTTFSPAIGKHIAMGFLKNGKARKGETIRVENFVENESLTAKVVSQHFFDAKGERQNG